MDSDSDSEPTPKKQKLPASAMKVQRVDKLAKELNDKHGDKYNRVQYKLWAEAIDVNQHSSKDDPPNGPIWSSTLAKTSRKAKKPSTPSKQPTSSTSTVSPGRKIDLQ